MLRKKYAAYAFAVMIAAPSMAPDTVHAQGTPESASDATTTMDKQLGNQTPPRDNTLSNQEVEQLQQEGAGGQQQTTGATGTVTGGSGTVSGTTAIYKEKGGSAEKTEGQ